VQEKVSAMADYVPHPLVTSVALKLAEKDVGTLKASARPLVKRVAGKGGAIDAGAYSKATKQAKGPTNAAEKNTLATALANQANLNGLSLFAGFLGGPVVDHERVTWRLLYLDSRLDTWMLVPEDKIIVSEQLKDDNAPSGLRDVLWVDSTASLVRGSGPRTNHGRFLVGELTRAGDFAASTSGGTFSAATGLLCEATTPGCCTITRTRC
jgi:hypothetical protein